MLHIIQCLRNETVYNELLDNKETNMREWSALTKDGVGICEGDMAWQEICDDIQSLELEIDGQMITLPDDAAKYVQGKTASVTFGNGKVEIESRYIGFSMGNNMIIIRVDEKSKNISVEITKCQ